MKFSVRPLALAAFCWASVLLLTGCGSTDAPSQPTAPAHVDSYTVALPGGRTVVCVSFYASAITCDWAGAR